MKIVYTNHLKFRLRIREIPYGLPEKIFNQTKEHYYDKIAKHNVAIDSVELKGKIREMAVIYDELADRVEIITVHPLKPYQKISRVKSGRWKRI